MITKKENHLKLIPQNNGVCYNESHNYLTTRINTSCTGNIYHTCLRLSKNLSIVIKIGIGKSKVFLNNITIYSYPNGKRRVIGTQFYNRFEYSEAEIISCVKKIISKDIVEAFYKNKTQYDIEWLKNFIKVLVNETMQNQKEAFNTIKR